MESLIFAARIILLRFLRLLIAITIEAAVYRRSLNISPKQSVESALMINMFAEISGAIFFSFLQSIVPLNVFRHLNVYLILQNFQTLSPDVFALTLFYFIIFLLAKWVGLLLLNMFIFEEKIERVPEAPRDNSKIETMNQWGSQFKTATKAHTVSYAVILLFVFFRIYVINL
ncbi:MAG: hypothetical protein SWJ54_11840 [Cyanobacteriota bacterium]|nr:hypothetical protein [Cyanobacteriota bacterium]